MSGAAVRPTVLAGWMWLAEETQGDDGAAKLREGRMEVGPAHVADLQAPEAVEPGERPFDHQSSSHTLSRQASTPRGFPSASPGPTPGAVRPWASPVPAGAAARSAPTTHQATVPSPWHPPPRLLFCFLGCLHDGFVRRTKGLVATPRLGAYSAPKQARRVKVRANSVPGRSSRTARGRCRSRRAHLEGGTGQGRAYSVR
jgi:hypothetical protein